MKIDKGGIRQDKMSSGERLAAMVKGKPMDRIPFIPFILGFAAKNVGISLADFYGDAEKSYWASKLTNQQYGLDGHPGLGFADYGAWEFGGEVRFPHSEYDQSLIVTHRPVESEEQGWELRLPDVRRAGWLPILMEYSRVEQKHEGKVTCFGMEPFAIAVSTTGAQRFCQWMMKKPKLCHHLLRLATEHRIQVLEYWADTFGIENVRFENATGPESNYLISPKAFEEFVLPYTRELHERALAMGVRSIFCHICGDHNLNLPYWEQIPFGDPGMMSFGPEMDITTAVKHLGDKNIIFGNVPATTILLGTPEEIYEECRKCIEKGKKAPRGFVLMAGCEVPVDTPPYNFWAMRKAVSDFGWYD